VKPLHLIPAALCALLLLFPFLAQITIAAQRDPNLDTGATWRTYPPGQAPPARTLSIYEVGALANRGELNERLYLRGKFRVTASVTGRAVLRDANRPNEQSPRVVVEYPLGHASPQEGEHLIRDAMLPYQIKLVRRGVDGVITIYVREIIDKAVLTNDEPGWVRLDTASNVPQRRISN
jgi:hypothetical protein